MRRRTGKHSRSVGLLLVALGAGAGACLSLGGPYREYEIRFEGGAPSPLDTSPSDAELIDAAARLMRDTLGLPFPPAVKAYVFVNEATLVDGLIKIAGLKSDEAWDRGRYAGGVATRVGIFLRGDHLARMDRLGRAALFAHELTHVSQHELAGGGRAAEWIREGHADWVQFQVLDLLGYRAYAESRDDIVRCVVGSATPIKFFPDLQDLASGARWVQATSRLGVSATYGQAFLAVDWLVERYGSARLTEFLGRFALGTDPLQHWRAVYPIAERQFVDEFRARLLRLGEAMPSAAAGSPGVTPPASCR